MYYLIGTPGGTEILLIAGLALLILVPVIIKLWRWALKKNR